MSELFRNRPLESMFGFVSRAVIGIYPLLINSIFSTNCLKAMTLFPDLERSL